MSDHPPRTQPKARRAEDANEPIWRRDFPYTAAGEETVTRREFTRYLALASGAFAVGNVGVAAWTSARQEVAAEPMRVVALDDVAVGGSYLFRYPGPDDPAMVVRLGEDELVGWSQKCTHLGCVVFYDEEEELLECPCHEGFFDVRTGRVIAGPPERPLPHIALEVRDGDIWALGVELHGREDER